MSDSKLEEVLAGSEDILARAQRLERDSYHDFWTSVVECSEILRAIDPNQRKLWLAKVLEEKIPRAEWVMCPVW